MQEWDAIVFHSTLPDGKNSCKLRIEGLHATGETEDKAKFTLDLRSARLTLGGTGRNLLYLRPVSLAEPVFTVRDRSIVQALKQVGNPDLIAEAKDFRKNVWQYRAWLVWSLVTLVVVSAVLTGTFILYGPDLALMMIPYSVDEKLGELSSTFAIANAKGNADPMIQAAVTKITGRIADALEENPFEFDVQVVKSSTVNAFALPGGKIVVFTGLLRSMDSPEELAGVLCHEIIHVVRRHGVRQLIQSAGNTLLLRAIIGDSTPLSDLLTENSRKLIGFKFSRGMETEADVLGLTLMKRARIDPCGFKKFLERLQSKEVPVPREMEWLSTHPATGNRIAELEKLIKEQGNFDLEPLDVDWQKIKEILDKED